MLMDFFSQNLNLLIIPIVSAIVGFSTNLLAVKMMFYPMKFVGIRPIFGWQGIIPSRVKEMAEIEVDLLLSKLMSIDDIAKRIDPKILSQQIQRRLKQSVHSVINDMMRDISPGVWSMLPGGVKHLIYIKVDASLPRIVPKLVEDVQHNIRELIDLRSLIVNKMVDNPEILNELFLKVGAKEFTFIERSGFYFGFLLGIPTMIAWHYYQAWWLLVGGGLLVGYATNWIALHMIFEPKHPTKIGPFVIQGLFLKRQEEAAGIYCEVIEDKLLNTEIMAEAILQGESSDQIMEILSTHIGEAIDEHLNLIQPYTSAYLGPDEYYSIKENIVKRLFKDSEIIFSYAHEYATDAINIGKDLTEKMCELTPEEFEGIIRPAYQADEWKLILIGGILGMLAGYGQLLILRPDLVPVLPF